MYEESEAIQEQTQFEGLVQGLIENKYGCCDDFVSPSTLAGLNTSLQALIVADKMKAAGLGNKHDLHLDSLIRGDKIYWIDDQSIDQYEEIYLNKIRSFISYLNSSCFTSINSFECHYARYEQMSFYKRHIDQFKTEKGRKYSIVLYLNENWQEEDGGLLSLYPNGDNKIDIAPIAGRIVFFRSDEMEHEVHPSFTRDRRSIAGWLKN